MFARNTHRFGAALVRLLAAVRLVRSALLLEALTTLTALPALASNVGAVGRPDGDRSRRRTWLLFAHRCFAFLCGMASCILGDVRPCLEASHQDRTKTGPDPRVRHHADEARSVRRPAVNVTRLPWGEVCRTTPGGQPLPSGA